MSATHRHLSLHQPPREVESNHGRWGGKEPLDLGCASEAQWSFQLTLGEGPKSQGRGTSRRSKKRASSNTERDNGKRDSSGVHGPAPRIHSKRHGSRTLPQKEAETAFALHRTKLLYLHLTLALFWGRLFFPPFRQHVSNFAHFKPPTFTSPRAISLLVSCFPLASSWSSSLYSPLIAMAETATSPAPAADKADKQANVRPAKPDENLFKQELAKAEKEHKASMDRLV
jgi:hypothetical protein